MNNKPKILYHGSQHKITDGVIRMHSAHINGMKTPITATFATSSLTHAKIYAAMRVIGVRELWKNPGPDNTLYVQKMNPDISGKVYVYELDSDGFKRDNSDYYALTDKKIMGVHEFDVMQEIKEVKIKVYVLKDEFNIPNMPMDTWKELLKDESNFELYKPGLTNIDMAILSQMKDLGLNK